MVKIRKNEKRKIYEEKSLRTFLTLAAICFLGNFRSVHAEVSNDNYEKEIVSKEESIIEFDLEDDYSRKVITEEDGTTAIISLTAVPEDNNSSEVITPFLLTRGKTYHYSYIGSKNRYSFDIKLSNSSYTLNKISNLQYKWKDGTVKSTSVKKLTSKTGQVQLVIDTPWGGTKTDTAAIKIHDTGGRRGGHMTVTRNKLYTTTFRDPLPKPLNK